MKSLTFLMLMLFIPLTSGLAGVSINTNGSVSSNVQGVVISIPSFLTGGNITINNNNTYINQTINITNNITYNITNNITNNFTLNSTYNATYDRFAYNQTYNGSTSTPHTTIS